MLSLTRLQRNGAKPRATPDRACRYHAGSRRDCSRRSTSRAPFPERPTHVNDSWEDPRTIGELESDLEDALCELVELESRGELPPELRPLLWLAPADGASVHVSLRLRESGRHLKRQSALGEWKEKGGAWIVFAAPELGQAPHAESTGVPLDDFILALDQAERDPHLSFISLKWFRDTYLVKHGYAWASDPDLPRRLIQEATDQQILLMHKVPNPKMPDFPVTSIRLNRENERVRQLVGASTPEPGGADQKARDTTQ